MSDFYARPDWRFHALGGNREGQYAIRLGGKERLILRFESDTHAVVVEVSMDHYG